MLSLCKTTIIRQWKELKRNPPKDFIAKLTKNSDGTRNFLKWQLQIPGPENSPWEGGVYKVMVLFPEEYPILPPRCVFTPTIFHPNIYPSGTVCSNLLNENEEWNKNISIKEIVKGIKNLLAHPNLFSPANSEPYYCMKENEEEYRR